MTNKDGETQSRYIPESWASQYYGYIYGHLKIGDKVHDFLLELNDAITLMNSKKARDGDFGIKNARPCFMMFIKTEKKED